MELAGFRRSPRAPLLLYDGSPFVRGADGRPGILFDYADAERMTHFGTSAKFIDAIAKAEFAAAPRHQLSSLRAMFSTGSPLAPEGFDYVYREIKADILLASISGGTDIVSCFVLMATRCCRYGAAKSSAPASAWRLMCSTTKANRSAGEGRTGVQQTLPGDADRFLERRCRQQIPRRLFRKFRQYLVSRRISPKSRRMAA